MYILGHVFCTLFHWPTFNKLVMSDASTISCILVATPFSVTFGSNEINTYYENEEKAAWSAQSDMNLTSSSEFNKLQQTNVSNYDCLLNSDTNSKSPSRRPPSASKATDLNHIIQHSLNRLNQVSSNIFLTTSSSCYSISTWLF